MSEDFDIFTSGGPAVGAEEDPAAAFLAQQESEIAGIENDDGFGEAVEDGEQVPQEPVLNHYAAFGEETATVNGDMFEESNGPTDAYAAIARADHLSQEPESIRKWREEQKKRLDDLDAVSRKAEVEWKEKAKKELEEWYVRQNEQMEKNKINNRASEEIFVKECNEDTPGTEWERVARLCDFNPKASKQSKDVSRMRSVLISLKQTPLIR
ncbi:clathrin light chain B isoform X2 [Latimeria chalumnae]|uniref:Clathrin light chain n=1 Tax=Latimeria chalumnae TaxID=7897 RepID=H3B510_LATCH|nr:PREDICTED: clathrin light chain B isoform X2 [Latimeria chalumnae]|eukprot:XP_005993439.1 PREDICTED: clathrin light chain B isoform X2 [Latimeria chalumnae]